VLLKVFLEKLPKVTDGFLKQDVLYSCVRVFLPKLARTEFIKYLCPDYFFFYTRIIQIIVHSKRRGSLTWNFGSVSKIPIENNRSYSCIRKVIKFQWRERNKKCKRQL